MNFVRVSSIPFLRHRQSKRGARFLVPGSRAAPDPNPALLFQKENLLCQCGARRPSILDTQPLLVSPKEIQNAPEFHTLLFGCHHAALLSSGRESV